MSSSLAFLVYNRLVVGKTCAFRFNSLIIPDYVGLFSRGPSAMCCAVIEGAGAPESRSSELWNVISIFSVTSG